MNKGWVWLKDEILKMYSPRDSFFSKKRVESGIAFAFAQLGMMSYLFIKLDTMDIYDLVMWAGVEFGVAGYMVTQIQWEKKNEAKKPNAAPVTTGATGPTGPAPATGTSGTTGTTEDIPNPDTY